MSSDIAASLAQQGADMVARHKYAKRAEPLKATVQPRPRSGRPCGDTSGT